MKVLLINKKKNESNIVTGNNIIKSDRNDILNYSLEYIKNELEKLQRKCRIDIIAY